MELNTVKTRIRRSKQMIDELRRERGRRNMMTFPEFEEDLLKESFPEVSAEASERFRMMEAGYTE